MSTQQTDASTSNANWGTLVIVLWAVIGAFVLGYLIKNGDLDKKTSQLNISAPGAPAAPLVDPAPVTAPEATPTAPAMETAPMPSAAPAGPDASSPTPVGPSTAPAPAPATTAGA